MVRLWDVAYDGYNGGKDCRAVDWASHDPHDTNSIDNFCEMTYDLNKPYEGPSMMVMAFGDVHTEVWPSPIVFHDNSDSKSSAPIPLDGEHAHVVDIVNHRVFSRQHYRQQYMQYYELMPNFSKMHNTKSGGYGSQENESTCCSGLAFQGTHKVFDGANPVYEITGNGHHGADYVGAASVRSGKGLRPPANSITNARLLG